MGLVAAFFVGLAAIWRSPDSAIEDEYRRVENAGTTLPETWMGFPVEYDEALPEGIIVIQRPRPYNWATREPMVWSDSHDH